MWPNPQETKDLVTFIEEVLNEKPHFCAILGLRFTPVSSNALQTFSSKTSSAILPGTRFNSVVSLLLYFELVIALRSNCMTFVSKWELNILLCCNSEWALLYFDEDSLNSSDIVLSFELISLTKLELISVSSLMKSWQFIFPDCLIKNVRDLLAFMYACYFAFIRLKNWVLET